MISLPIIHTPQDLTEALERLDVIINAPEGSLEADERSALSDLIAAYEDRHPVIPVGGALGIIRRIMATHELSQHDLPEIGAQSVVSAVLSGKRRLNSRMSLALAERFHLPVSAFLQET